MGSTFFSTSWSNQVGPWVWRSIFVAMSKSFADTPLMQQHRAIKQKYPDAILLFRVGDFYETFGEDAVNASKVLRHYPHQKE